LRARHERFAWTNSQVPDARRELVDGVPFKMLAPQTRRHGRTKLAVRSALSRAIADAELPSEALVDSVGVKIDDRNGRIPGVSAQCEPLDDDAIWLTARTVPVEVVSPGSGTRDGQDKLSDYFGLPSVQHSLLVYVERRLVVHHRRGASDRDIATRIVEAGDVELAPRGFRVPLASFFDDELGRPENA
jgi:Uma2 family endonuclease